MRALFDTNILVDYLNGALEARAELARYSSRLISLVTWMEVLVGARNSDEERTVRSFLDAFSVVELDRAVAEDAVRLRREASQESLTCGRDPAIGAHAGLGSVHLHRAPVPSWCPHRDVSRVDACRSHGCPQSTQDP